MKRFIHWLGFHFYEHHHYSGWYFKYMKCSECTKGIEIDVEKGRAQYIRVAWGCVLTEEYYQRCNK